MIEELLPDMILVKPVTNANGLPIVAAGTLLDPPMIERLQRMGTTSVYVEGDAGDAGEKTLTELMITRCFRKRAAKANSQEKSVNGL